MKKRNNRLNKKLILVAAAVLVVGGAGTGVALAMQDEPKKVVIEQSSSVEPQNDPVQAITEQETTTEPVEHEEQPVEVVNPYPEGSNIRLVFDVRAAAGLETPVYGNSDIHGDTNYWGGYLMQYKERGETPPLATSPTWYTPTQYAIVLKVNSQPSMKVWGVVKSVDAESFVLSNTSGDTVVPMSDYGNYRFMDI